MSDEDWDNDEYEPQPVKFASDSIFQGREQSRGGKRGRVQRGRGAPGGGRQNHNRDNNHTDGDVFRNRGRGNSSRRSDDNKGSSNSGRGRGRGDGRYFDGDRNTNKNGTDSSIHRGRGRGGSGRQFSNEGKNHVDNDGFNKRGAIRGRGGPVRQSDSNRQHDDRSNSDDNSTGFVRNRGRGRSLRGNSRREELGRSTERRTDDDEEWNSDSETSSANKELLNRGRGLTPPRGARGRTRSSSGRLSEGSLGRKEQPTRGRGRGRGRRSNLTSRSDGEESDGSNDGHRSSNSRGSGRGRPRQPLRSKSFRDTTSSGWEGRGRVGVSRGGGRGWRGRGGGGGHKPGGDEERKPPEQYIPPEPTEDEDLMFHSGISTGVHFSKYDSIGVKVTGEKVPQPIESFENAGLCDLLVQNIRKSGYKKPTPVQKNSLPIILSGRDLMACAQTGSGKTAAFLIPVIDDLLRRPGDCSATDNSWVEPLAVVLCPTRELAIQTFQEARKFAHGSILKVALIYGGTVTQHQLSQIKRGCHILVAVPGRLESFLKEGHIKFSRVGLFVLDEADRMLELGFKDSVKRILSHDTIPKQAKKRTLMFSATFPQEIQELASTYLEDYVFLAVGEVGGACSDVQQLFHQVAKFDKRDKLLEILKENSRGDELTLVFVGMKRHADFLAVYLCENDLQSTSIHGDRYQSQREEALTDFKSGSRPILIATAVAARGLDIKNVAHVINYDLPSTIEEYVHRIGRTGRVGNCGKSTSFYDPGVDRPIAKNLVRILTQANQPIPDFLKAESGNEVYSDGEVDNFGGTDIRTTNMGGAESKKAVDEEECWD